MTAIHQSRALFNFAPAPLSRLGCKQLLLTHLGEEMLARRDQIEVGLAQNGMVIEL